MTDTLLSDAVLSLYSPGRDRFGVMAWRELVHSSTEVRSAFCEAHFNWTTACDKSQIALKARGRTVGLKLTLFAVGHDDEAAECEIEYEVEVSRSRGRSFRFTETITGDSFGQAMFLIGNPFRLADIVADEIDAREPKSTS
ncbi:hypothetical protein [Mesorhizobium sp. LNHC209A00]|uniref:hypothetical protein n=1 Tax=Mesorhizobium TaxID=68287 RepID=UPI0012EB3E58|nr:hypothetical protein [Mesorhizobium sp. LNHC209A00]